MTRDRVVVGIAALVLAVGLGALLLPPAPRVVPVPPWTPPPITVPDGPWEPLPIPEPPVPPAVVPAHWSCNQAGPDIEDRSLHIILASQVQNDPLFGQPEITMERAECASRRWSREGR